MGLVSTLRGKARTLGDQLRRVDVGAVDKAFLVAERALAVAGLSERLAVTRRDIWQLAAPPPARAAGGLDVRTAGEGDLDGVCAVDETAPVRVQERLRRGDLIYVGLRGGRLVAHAWFHRGPRPYVEDEPILVRYALGPTTHWGYAFDTARGVRPSEVLVPLLQTALRDLFLLHGATQVQTATTAVDSAARLIRQGLGFESLGRLMGFATPWGRSVVWIEGGGAGDPPRRPRLKSYLLGPNSSHELSFPPDLEARPAAR